MRLLSRVVEMLKPIRGWRKRGMLLTPLLAPGVASVEPLNAGLQQRAVVGDLEAVSSQDRELVASVRLA